MKKRIALLLAAVLCLSLAACGKAESEKYTKYEPLIDCLENNDYEGAMEKINGYYEDYKQSHRGDGENEDSSQPENGESSAETEPQEKTIELTLDNWQEYLEFRPTIGLSFNAFGEFQGLNDVVCWNLCFKKDIDSKINTMNDNRIVAEYSCTDGYIGKYSCDINVREGDEQAACTVQGIATEEEVANSRHKDGFDQTGDGFLSADGGLTVAMYLIDNIESVTDNTYSFTGPAWASMKVVRIEGAFTIKE